MDPRRRPRERRNDEDGFVVLAWCAIMRTAPARNLMAPKKTIRQLPIIAALGTPQTLAWASSYYLPARQIKALHDRASCRMTNNMA